ncbi:MAG: hypothetical protein GTN80_08215 [Nitrososphaeria archaeon]|nr:hypothetical protein [Nitrososphaeria archaeon]NIQ33607.1 hypothetical protein [Nitrososphaeria archaeon]
MKRELTKKEQQERFDAMLEADQIEELERSEGWKIIKREIFDKGLNVQRFIGCRSSRLIWMQGFMAALDTILKFIEAKKRIKAQIVREHNG